MWILLWTSKRRIASRISLRVTTVKRRNLTLALIAGMMILVSARAAAAQGRMTGEEWTQAQEEKIDKLIVALALDAEKVEVVKGILLESAQTTRAAMLKARETGDRGKVRSAVKKNQEQTRKALEEHLTEDQMKSYDEFVKENSPRRRGQGNRGQGNRRGGGLR